MSTPPGKSEPVQPQTQSSKPSPQPQLTLLHRLLSLPCLNSLQIAIWLWLLGLSLQFIPVQMRVGMSVNTVNVEFSCKSKQETKNNERPKTIIDPSSLSVALSASGSIIS